MAKRLILVVDDDSAVRTLLCSILETAGHRVESASNGREAIEFLERETPDLVLMDLVMPEREGIETIKEVRDRWPLLRIVAVSGAFGGEYLKVAKMLGAIDVLGKPFSVEEVRDLVARSLEGI